ncbi:hypothetical protein [Methylosinus sporium]|uniref:Uncharacterized protein n=1 Tax=Methylosinus sporium TaxID=428 RepID=A0A2U1SQX3_METSR|nr:hypothetical protein [Methylosinus sporium]PWB94009.1 hypothetical protein C5689_09625 [Methylosinus sporium]
MSFGLENFKNTPLGEKVGEMLNNPAQISDMIALSRHRIPAVQDLGKPILALGMPITDEDKKLIGRWVKDVMEAHGYTTDPKSKGRVAPGNLFTTGAIYYSKVIHGGGVAA